MDRSVNPGNVERQLDETPVQDRSGMDGGGSESGMLGSPSDRQNAHDRGETGMDRQGMQGSPQERDSMRGSSQKRDSMHGSSGDSGEMLEGGSGAINDTQQRLSGREGGYGYDRPADVGSGRDEMLGSSRDTDQGMDRVSDDAPGRGSGGMDREVRGGDSGGMTRDW